MSTVLAHYGKGKVFASKSKLIFHGEYVFMNGYIVRAWYKKLKHQALFEYRLYGDTKSKYVLFDVQGERTLEEYVKSGFFYEYFDGILY